MAASAAAEAFATSALHQGCLGSQDYIEYSNWKRPQSAGGPLTDFVVRQDVGKKLSNTSRIQNEIEYYRADSFGLIEGFLRLVVSEPSDILQYEITANYLILLVSARNSPSVVVKFYQWRESEFVLAENYDLQLTAIPRRFSMGVSVSGRYLLVATDNNPPKAVGLTPDGIEMNINLPSIGGGSVLSFVAAACDDKYLLVGSLTPNPAFFCLAMFQLHSGEKFWREQCIYAGDFAQGSLTSETLQLYVLDGTWLALIKTAGGQTRAISGSLGQEDWEDFFLGGLDTERAQIVYGEAWGDQPALILEQREHDPTFLGIANKNYLVQTSKEGEDHQFYLPSTSYSRTLLPSFFRLLFGPNDILGISCDPLLGRQFFSIKPSESGHMYTVTYPPQARQAVKVPCPPGTAKPILPLHPCQGCPNGMSGNGTVCVPCAVTSYCPAYSSHEYPYSIVKERRQLVVSFGNTNEKGVEETVVDALVSSKNFPFFIVFGSLMGLYFLAAIVMGCAGQRWVDTLLSLVGVLDPESEVAHLEKEVHKVKSKLKLNRHSKRHSRFITTRKVITGALNMTLIMGVIIGAVTVMQFQSDYEGNHLKPVLANTASHEEHYPHVMNERHTEEQRLLSSYQPLVSALRYTIPYKLELYFHDFRPMESCTNAYFDTVPELTNLECLGDPAVAPYTHTALGEPIENVCKLTCVLDTSVPAFRDTLQFEMSDNCAHYSPIRFTFVQFRLSVGAKTGPIEADHLIWNVVGSELVSYIYINNTQLAAPIYEESIKSIDVFVRLEYFLRVTENAGSESEEFYNEAYVSTAVDSWYIRTPVHVSDVVACHGPVVTFHFHENKDDLIFQRAERIIDGVEVLIVGLLGSITFFHMVEFLKYLMNIIFTAMEKLLKGWIKWTGTAEDRSRRLQEEFLLQNPTEDGEGFVDVDDDTYRM